MFTGCGIIFVVIEVVIDRHNNRVYIEYRCTSEIRRNVQSLEELIKLFLRCEAFVLFKEPLSKSLRQFHLDTRDVFALVIDRVAVLRSGYESGMFDNVRRVTKRAIVLNRDIRIIASVIIQGCLIHLIDTNRQGRHIITRNGTIVGIETDGIHFGVSGIDKT